MTDEHEKMENFQEYLDFVETNPGSVVEAVVTRINPAEGISVDFGGKGEGIIQQNELIHSIEKYSVGQKIKAQILKINDEEGYALLSEKRPYIREMRNTLRKAYESKIPVKGKIVQTIPGGYRVLISNIFDAFLPGSQSLLKRNQSFQEKEMNFLIIEYSVRRNKLHIVVSRKALLERLKKEFFNTHKVGDEIEGTVESIRMNHAIIDFDGIKAFLPRSEMSHDPSVSPDDILKKNDQIKVKIIEINPARSSITVSLKALEPDPWLKVSERYSVGTVVQGTVKSIMPFGIFLNLEPGLDGLIHISEVFWTSKKADLHKYFKIGQIVQAEVIEIDPEKHRIALSYKKAKGDPWEEVVQKYNEGDVVSGKIVRILPAGVIVELEDGVSGFVPKSELSWNKVKDPTDLFKEKDRLNVKILSIDKQKRRMRLSVKQLTPDPWDEVVTKLSENSVAKALVKSKVNSGFIIELKDFSIDGLMPASHADESLKEGDEVEVLVLRLIPERRKLLVSQKKLEEKKAYEEYKSKIDESTVKRTLGDRMKS
ncbi:MULTISPECIES: 30S ribosomal protein S1 [Pseudothermotoga]|jgi:ribosomal protein S1|uniref:RNA binding S1 domain protein n=1 Tax=Pseudothermotoga lettingae (strain ATCC BAA-301 / DSM 14385 / NBRC 107922 / TMO) TaxID=416591 RepID=A8F7S1_PSELT|nr:MULTISPECIES: 30S ribosomal protein S1 [Pseudothermotoga]ABV34205.1 RNA binding S1 domain protein [Pseudothermotoga lettingae TMO]MDK2884811.1 small subunit ribosomal protein [Pseudothermotoga sp.]GLI48851.1 ribosomal protein S1 [Pseudothermotoga lettingae TMO]